MKIERRVVIMSEDNHEITDPRKGFIVVGDIYAATVNEEDRPSGGLIRPNFDEQGKVNRWMAFTKEEMLRALGYTIEELDEISTTWKKKREYAEAEKDRVF